MNKLQLPNLDKKKPVIVSLSGGLDSICLFYECVRTFDHVIAVTFDYGQNNNNELKVIEHINMFPNVEVIKVKLPHIQFLNKTSELMKAHTMALDKQSFYVPFRNLQFQSILASIAENHNVNSIFYGSCMDDTFWDSQPSYIENFQDILNLSKKDITLYTPLIRLSKGDTLYHLESIKEEFLLKYNIDVTKTVWSCYYNGEKECGICPACKSKIKGYKQLGYTNEQLIQIFEKVN